MSWWDRLGIGRPVTRATWVLAITAGAPIFSVAAGRILLTSIVGVVTTLVAGAANVFLQSHPTVATAPTTPLCAALNIAAYTVGSLLGITGVPGDAMVPALAADAGAIPAMTVSLIIPIGDIEIVCDAAPAGEVQWTVTYLPIDDAAYVVAA